MAKKKTTSDTAAGETATGESSTAATKAPRRKRAKRKKKRAGKKAAATKKVIVKRKKKAGGPNKSKAIRDYLAEHKNAGPTEVAAALKQEGIEVTPAFVSNIKSKSKLLGSKRKAKRGRPVGSGGSRSDSVSMSALLEAKKLAEQVGGIDKAEAAVAALKKLL